MDFSDLGSTTPSKKKGRFDFSDLGDTSVKLESSNAQQSGLLEKAVNVLSPVTGVLQKFGEVTQPVRESVAYGTSPQGLMESGYTQLSNLAGKAGEFATEQLGQRGLNPYLSALAGLGVSYAPDVIAGVAQPSLPAFGKAATEATEAAVKGAAKNILPRTFKSTAGIPEQATEALINDPSIRSRLPGTPESVAGVMRNVQGLVDQAKRGIGKAFGDIYRRYVGIEGPMQEIIDTPIGQRIKNVKEEIPTITKQVVSERDPFTGAIKKRTVETPSVKSKNKIVPGELDTFPAKTHSYDDVIINKNLADEAFKKGDSQSLKYLYKEYVGSPKTDLSAIKITKKDELAILTRLKREIQQQAKYNKDPITLRPIDTSKDAAFKKMAQDVDVLRSRLPNGEKLALADKAWEEINDIYGTIQKDLADPGKAKDTFMRIIKGDQTWLTSGKYQNKINAIKKVEKITGKNILKPALEELTSMIFKEKTGKGIAYNAIPAAGLGTALTLLFTGNPLGALGAGLGSAATFAAGSPRVIGSAIQSGAKIGNYLNTGVNLAATQVPKIGLGLGLVRNRRSQ